MSQVTDFAVQEGTTAPVPVSAVPVAGTDEIQTLTIGGTPDGGTFKLGFQGFTTAAINWTATDATLVSDIDAALEALPSIETGNVTTAAGTVTSGIGTITLTFVSGLGKLAINSLVTVEDNSLTGTAPTLAIAETTPGVTATRRGADKGALLLCTNNGKTYTNTGTAAAPTWTVVGTQT